MDISKLKDSILAIKNNIETVIVGKSDVIEMILAALLAEGHVLLTDVPGTGKTMLSKSLAKSFDLTFKRIQFTPDLLPSDLTGINYYNPKLSEFIFRQGAMFTNILLADEINRATPRTQSSLLECMEECQITVDGETYVLDKPFFVIATQNPVETQGTFPLPEAQLDRFLIQLKMGYPETKSGVDLLKRHVGKKPIDGVQSVCDSGTLVEMQSFVKEVFVHEDIMDYVVRIAEKTRVHDSIAIGVSPRGTLSLIKAAQAYAAINEREYVIPDDIKRLIKPVFCHRIIIRGGVKNRDAGVGGILDGIMSEITVPTENFSNLIG